MVGKFRAKFYAQGRVHYTKSKSKFLTQCHLPCLFLEPFFRSFVTEFLKAIYFSVSSNTDAVAMRSPGFSLTNHVVPRNSREDSGLCPRGYHSTNSRSILIFVCRRYKHELNPSVPESVQLFSSFPCICGSFVCYAEFD